MDWILSGLVLVVNFLLGRKIKWGWILAIVNSFAWMYWAVFVLDPPQYGLVPSSILNLVISVTSAIKWFREDKERE